MSPWVVMGYVQIMLAKKNNIMKVGICLSGIPKFWKKSLLSIKKYFPDADIFIHAWDVDDEDISKETVQREEWYHRSVLGKGKYNILQIIEQFNPVSYKIEKFKDKKNIFFSKREKYINEKIRQVEPTTNIGALSMFYSVYQSNKIKKEYEILKNKKYDIIVRMRFDSDIKDWRDDLFENVSTICIPEGRDHAVNPPGINDQFSFGPSELMDKLCSCYKNIDNAVKESRGVDKDGNIHTTGMYTPEVNFLRYLEIVNVFPDLVKRIDLTVEINYE